MSRKIKVTVTAWDLIERVKTLLKGDKVKLDGINEVKTKWIQGEMLEPLFRYNHKTDEEKITGWGMCFVGGLASAEHLLMRPGTKGEELQEVHAGNLLTDEGKEALEVCAEIIKEQFPERAPETENKRITAQGTVIEFNDHDQTTLNDVYTVLEKAAVVLAERGK